MRLIVKILLAFVLLKSLQCAAIGQTDLTDSNFQTAINLWFSDEVSATATYGHISDWNTSTVTDMSSAFKDRSTFNQDISDWNVSSVTDMADMFYEASAFNQT